uniref:TrbG/VirB9 family P-type conjugative transfer protein n=1 Tax=Altererythrobacter segetis TaxID=1104773 RepID=UPI00140C222F|nr:TrbG/VirB9 family P-type conjugative transfer protein [Altererythrobacter segetis]
MRFAVVVVAFIATASSAWAEDPRLVDLAYKPGQIVRIEGRSNVQATIRFGGDELIENVAIGDSSDWQVTPNRRATTLFIKPLVDRATTNMTVITDKHVYLFDLIANPANKNPIYMLSFSHPGEPAGTQPPQPSADKTIETPTTIEMAAASDPYAVVDPAQLNFAWAGSGDKKLLPARIYDDGEATFLTWASRSAIPAILVRDRNGTEGPVNFAVRGNVIVIDGVPREIILRSGREAATISNNGPLPAPAILAQSER